MGFNRCTSCKIWTAKREGQGRYALVIGRSWINIASMNDYFIQLLVFCYHSLDPDWDWGFTFTDTRFSKTQSRPKCMNPGRLSYSAPTTQNPTLRPIFRPCVLPPSLYTVASSMIHSDVGCAQLFDWLFKILRIARKRLIMSR